MSDNTDNNVVQSDEISLREFILKVKRIFQYLLKKWHVILLVASLGGLLGLVYSLTTKTKYVAILSFAVQEKSNSTNSLISLVGQFGFNTIGGAAGSVFSGGNIMELLKSRNLIERTLLSKVTIDGKESTLIEYYFDINKVKEKWEKKGDSIISFPVNQFRRDFSIAQNGVLKKFADKITYGKLDVSRVSKEATLIQVMFTNEDELFAKYFTEILVKEVTDFYVQNKTELVRVNLTNFQLSADSVRRKLDAVMLKKALYADRNLDVVRQETRVSTQQDEIELQQSTAIYTEMVKNIEVLKFDLTKETPLVSIIDTPTMPLELDHLGKLKSIIIGGFSGGFLIVLYLLGVLCYRRVME